MKIKGLKISIFMLLLSICACGFVSLNHKEIEVHAASATSVDCYYLLGDNDVAYKSNTIVGGLEGLGDFIVGENQIELTATAKPNFQLVGWRIVYDEQESKVEYFDDEGLTAGSKIITLTAKDETDNGVDDAKEVQAMLTFTETNGYFTSGTFKIENVFEDITVNPVFDHIYYQVDINNLLEISSHTNTVDIDGNTLYYETSVENAGITEYKNSYIKLGADYYYYGSVFAEDGEFYTIHKTLTANPVDEKVDYLKGAYRLGEIVDFSMDINIVDDDLLTSKNVDVNSFSVVSNRTNNLYEYKPASTSNYFKVEQDLYLRTSNYNVNFAIETSSNYVNTINVNYHNLYVVDINLLVDGSKEHSEDAEILGNKQVFATEIRSNLSVYNFYSIIDLDALSFLAKSSKDNNSRSFGLNSISAINATTVNGTFRYYTFSDIDGVNNKSIYYSGLSQNIEVNVNYSSVSYEVQFAVAERKVDSNLNHVLAEMPVTAPSSLLLSRGESLLSGNVAPDDSIGEDGDFYFDTATTLIYEKLDDGWAKIEDYDGLSIVGYGFVGFANSLTSAVETNYEFTINSVEPVGTKVWLCFDKLDLSIVIENYNQVSIGSTKALDTITFTKSTSAGQITEVLDAEDLTGTSFTLSTIKLRLGESLIVTHKLNNGFNVRYSLLSPAEIQALIDDGKTQEEMEQYYINVLEFTEAFIANYAVDSTVTIYLYEEKLEYTITYEINIENDGTDNYLMGNIDVADIDEEQSNENFAIVKYDLNDIEISASNNNLGAEVSKIVVSGLCLNDSITLISFAKPFEDSTYVFNWFVDGKTTLTYVQDDNNYNHTEIISRTRTIQVVYSIPVAQVYIALDDDFASTPEFTYGYEIKVDGEVVTPIDSILYPNQYSIMVGKVLNITIYELGFGYKFIGYQVNEKPINKVSGLTFEHTTILGANEIVLKFERIAFQFYFQQYRAVVGGVELNGQYVQFDGLDYATLDVDNIFLNITKPEGYYVRTALIDGAEFNANVENNLIFRSLANNSVYGFNLAREDFISAIETYAVDRNSDGTLEVYIQLEYATYMYDIIVNHTDPQGNSHSTNVQYLYLRVSYTLNGSNASIDYPYAIDRVVFEAAVPYGSVAVVNVLGTLQTGLRFVGWGYTDTNLVTNVNGAKYLNLGVVKENREFLYMFTYESHRLVLDFNALQGNPSVEVNNESLNPLSATINLFDGIKITAGAIRANGYKFKAFVVNKATFTPYIYNEGTWASKALDLYILDGHAYVKNTSTSYNSAYNYYTYKAEEERFTDGEEFSIEKLILSDYVIESKNITISVEYELLQLLIVNQTVESDDGTITNPFLKEIFDFRIEELLLLTVTASENHGEFREITPTDTVTFYDAVRINIEINKNATEYLSGKGYDLTLGIKLIEVQVSGAIINVTNEGDGKYMIGFGVGEYLPEAGEEINIVYTVMIQQKNVAVTTTVVDSTSFYENVIMYAHSETAFGGLKDSNYRSVLDTNWQFMAPLTSYTEMSREYRKLFRTAGVKIFLTEYNVLTGKYDVVGSELNPESYANYGITLEKTTRVVSDKDIEEVQVKVDRLLYNFYIVFQVQPIIIFNGGPRFEKTFDCNPDGTGREQSLTIGPTNKENIQIADEIKPAIIVKYQLLKNGVLSGTELDKVLNVGEYRVNISFDTTDKYDWLTDVSVTENVMLVINPKDIALIYDAEAVSRNQIERAYNKSSSFNVANIFQFLIITDREDINIAYSSLEGVSSNLKLDSNVACYISSGGKDEATYQANESLYYNLYVYNIALQDTEFNRNFNMVTKDLVITSYIKIKKLAVDLEGLVVYSKVYDGTDVAEIDKSSQVRVSTPYDDAVIVAMEKLVVKFKDYSVGKNKVVVVDASTALGGDAARNYEVKNVEIKGLTIYPYSVSVKVEGIGEVELFNKRGLTDKDYINLIPVNATLRVQAIKPDDPEYAKIHGKISKQLQGNNEFNVAYTLSMTVNGEPKQIDRHLYLSVPRVKYITGAYFLTGDKTDDANYKVQKNRIVIDLNQTDLKIESLFITQTKILLKPWQIVLIVTSAVALISAVVLTFVIIRKRKFKEYSVHDKI